MKKLAALCSLLLLMAFVPLQAKIKFGKTEHIKPVAEMPKTEEFLLEDVALVGDDNKELKIDNKDYIGLGVKYTTFSIAGMPYWVTDGPVLVGTSSLRKDMYYDLTPQDADHLLKTAKIKKEDALKLTFWEKYLGWVVSLLLLAAVVIYNLYFKKEKPEYYHNNGDIIEDEKGNRI